MTALFCIGQEASRLSIISIAARGEGGSCGHHHSMSGRCWWIQAAVLRAFIDCGDERNPCRYSRCVMGFCMMEKWLREKSAGRSGRLTGPAGEMWQVDQEIHHHRTAFVASNRTGLVAEGLPG